MNPIDQPPHYTSPISATTSTPSVAAHPTDVTASSLSSSTPLSTSSEQYSIHKQLDLICEERLEIHLFLQKSNELDEEIDNLVEKKDSLIQEIKAVENEFKKAVESTGNTSELQIKLNCLNKQNEELTRSIKESKQERKQLNNKIENMQLKLERLQNLLLITCNQQLGGDEIPWIPVNFLQLQFPGLSTEKIKELLDLHKRYSMESLNRKIEYLRNIRQLVEKEKECIILKFGGKDIRLAHASFKLTFLGGDEHQQEKSPLLVTFYHQQESILKIVYKPRTAATDAAIIHLFFELNQLPESEKSGVDLPIYLIVESLNGQGSWWAYIHGQEIKDLDVYSFVQCLPISDEKTHACAHLRRLESICLAAGITDLHCENVIYQNGQLIPIDLEVVKPGDSTGLCEEMRRQTPSQLLFTCPELTGKELSCIQRFTLTQKFRISRCVPIHSREIAELKSDPNGAQLIAAQILNNLSENNEYDIVITQDQLTTWIQVDLQRGDTPYFIQLDNKVYHGSTAESSRLIAKKKEM